MNLKLPKGITIRNQRIQLAFTYEGERCRELLKAEIVINQKSITYAENKLRAIKVEIAENRFNYREHFPNSPKALKLEGVVGDDINRSVSEGIDMWLKVKEESTAKSTYEGYLSKARHVQDYFGNRRIRQLKKIDIIKFRKHLIDIIGLDIKTVGDVFTALRGAFDLAFEDGIIKDNLLSRIKNLKEDEDKESEADPFNQAELDRIAELKVKGYYRPQAINMFLFQCWTGLSFSEQLAVAWQDIDFEKWTLSIRRARVAGELKVPKEPSRNRTIDLLQPAIDILKEQKNITFHNEPRSYEVKRRNNVTTKTESLSFIFTNDKPESLDGLWKKRSVQDAYAAITNHAKVRHRGANQCRHTFASMLLTKYVPIDLVATLLGHTNSETTKKHYARVIPEDRPSMAKVISDLIRIDYSERPEESHTPLKK